MDDQIGQGSSLAQRGEPWAETIDIGFTWDVGAPLPHLFADGQRAIVVCRVGERAAGWDGIPKVIDLSNGEQDVFGIIEFAPCAAVRFGAPNDETFHGHPLWGKGLRMYAAHEVHNSPWLEEQIRINAVHPSHSEEAWRRNHHYLLLFHDEMFECLAYSLCTQLRRTNWESAVGEVLASFVAGRVVKPD
jgi:hypothetical protein